MAKKKPTVDTITAEGKASRDLSACLARGMSGGFPFSGRRHDQYQLYLTFADDGQGRDITRNLAPLLTFDQWLAA